MVIVCTAISLQVLPEVWESNACLLGPFFLLMKSHGPAPPERCGPLQLGEEEAASGLTATGMSSGFCKWTSRNRSSGQRSLLQPLMGCQFQGRIFLCNYSLSWSWSGAAAINPPIVQISKLMLQEPKSSTYHWHANPATSLSTGCNESTSWPIYLFKGFAAECLLVLHPDLSTVPLLNKD